MKQGIKFFIILVLIVVIGVLFFQYKKQNDSHSVSPVSTTTSPTTSTKKTYTSKKYKFSFSYPSTYEVMEYTPEHISVGNKTTLGFDSLADIAFILSEPDTQSTFEEFALDEARLLCDADGPNESLSCPEIKDLKSFTTGKLVDGSEFYTITQLKNLRTGTIVKGTKGPFIALNTTDLTPRMSLLLISNPIVQDVTAVNTTFIEAIARSVQF